mgnify:CR=1 FL=1
MNSFNEKEKKLNNALDKLKNLNLNNPDMQHNIENLSSQKTQLEIEKSQLEDKYKSLLEEHSNLAKKLEEFQQKIREQCIILAAIPFLEGGSESSILVCVVRFFAV